MSSVMVRNGFAAATLVIRAQFANTIAQTGEDIAETTRENMYPGHFYDTGLSFETTAWEQLGRLEGQVHIPTDYAADPEYGTPEMAPRPVLTPAVASEWPGRLHANWAKRDTLPPAPRPGVPGPVVSRP